jgi:hypothetical protein
MHNAAAESQMLHGRIAVHHASTGGDDAVPMLAPQYAPLFQRAKGKAANTLNRVTQRLILVD